MTNRPTIDDVDEARRLRALALTVIRSRLAPVGLRADVHVPLDTPEDAIAVIAAVAELGSVFLQRAAHAERTTPEQMIEDVIRQQDGAA